MRVDSRCIRDCRRGTRQSHRRKDEQAVPRARTIDAGRVRRAVPKESRTSSRNAQAGLPEVCAAQRVQKATRHTRRNTPSYSSPETKKMVSETRQRRLPRSSLRLVGANPVSASPPNRNHCRPRKARNGSRRRSHSVGTPSSPVRNTTIPPTMAHVVSLSPSALSVCHIASS